MFSDISSFPAVGCIWQGYKARAVELSTLQRAASHMASLTDINEAFMAGEAAFGACQDGYSGKMIIFTRTDNPYHCGTDISGIHAIANNEKDVPAEWIGADGCSVTQAYLDYARPLIQGELSPIYENGVPKHLVRK